jgi:hypothetical protein
MTATTTSDSDRRELDHRRSHGIDVTLSWSPAWNALFVTVVDEAGHSFELAAEPHEALDVFNHPYAYAPYRTSGVAGRRRSGPIEIASEA